MESKGVNLEVLLSIITFTITTYLGLVIYIKRKKSWTHRFFIILALLIDAYIVVNFLSLHPPIPTTENQLLWIRIVMFTTSFLGPTLVLFIHTFPRDSIWMKKKYIIILLCLMTLSAILSLSPLVFSSLEFQNGQPVPIPGPGIPVFFVDFVGLFIFSFVILVYKYYKTKGDNKRQYKNLLFGVLTSFSLMAISTVIFVVILKTSATVFLGPIFPVILMASIAYAIVRYRFMNIKFIITRSLVYLILVAVVAALFILISTFLVQSLEQFGINQYIVWAFFALIIVLGLDPLKNWFARITDNIFFKDKIDYNAELKRLSNLINEEIELDSLVTNFRLLLAQRLKLKHNTILIAAEMDQVYVPLDYFLQTKTADTAEQIRRHHLYSHSPFIGYLSVEHKTIVTDEFDRYIYDINDEAEQQRLSGVLDNLNELQAGVAVPIMRNDKLAAILILGEKISGETFSSEDINLFEVLASQLAAALERSRLYQEVRVFNIKLQKEVDRATSDLKKTNLQLEDANAHLQELDRAKSEFMSIASHQLRTPLTGIIGYLSMILEGDYGKVDPAQNKVISQVFDASKRLVRLVNMFLNVTRIEAGRFTLTFVELNFVDLVKSEIAELLPTANQKKLQLSLDPATTENILVMVDADKIRDVILNLIDNAIKYTQEGSIVVKVEREGEDEVRFSVKDSGVGVDPKEAKDLFHKFVRGSGIARIQPNGSGLGLYIVKKIVEGHAGKVWMESEGEGKGSTFIVVLPLKQTTEQYHAEPEAVFK